MIGFGFLPWKVQAQNAAALSESDSQFDYLPAPIMEDNFAELREQSPFRRHLNVSGSLILTGVARIEEDMVATMLDRETFQSFLVSRKTNAEGWQLVEVRGDQSDLETLTARIRVAGAEVVTVRYEDAPAPVSGMKGVAISTRIGNGTAGGGTGPHGGPDPRVLTPDQLKDARNAARNIRDGFQADGYPDKQTIPPEVVSKISRLSVSQRESINVKMYEYRNRGLGLPERQTIYNRLLDREVSRR
ncbi:MAG: hypothetical protein AAF357_05000 [Verrucomicrobiota bacterium]